jgi:hypothetical protein
VVPTATLDAVKAKKTTLPPADQHTGSYLNDNKRENLARNTGRKGKEKH